MSNYYDFKQAKEMALDMPIDFLKQAPKKVNGKVTYICPFCGNGSGNDGTGIVLDPSGDGKHYKCFKCGIYADIFDLWGAYSNTEGSERFNSLYEHYGIKERLTTENQAVKTSTPSSNHKTSVVKTTNYKNSYKQWSENAKKSDYFHSRGLSDSTIERFRLGIAELSVYNSEKKQEEQWKAAVLPIDDEHCILRNTDPNSTGQRYIKRGQDSPTYNIQCLYTAQQPIFIVEGHFDALSVIEVGGEAIALGTSNMTRDLRAALEKKKPSQPLIIALDSDGAGIAGGDKLEQELTALDIPFYRLRQFDDKGEYKDPNEALKANRTQFEAIIGNAKKSAAEVVELQEAKERNNFLGMSELAHLADFRQSIKSGKNVQFIPTGFAELDKCLNGGLFCGNLYVVGAMSSLGKTTFAMQILNQVAKSGKDVFLLSMEMPRHELTAKSISYLTMAASNGENRQLAKTSFEIECGGKYQHYTEEQRQNIEKSLDLYEGYAEHITICEGGLDTSMDAIREDIKRHIKFKGTKPLLVVDYLQILPPISEKLTDKQSMDRSILSLKQTARDFNIPVIVVSSFNRDNYSCPVSMGAFKESGAIEYTADTLLAFQFTVIENGSSTKKSQSIIAQEKAKTPRDVTLVLLKQRNGVTGTKIRYTYFSAVNYFKEVGILQPCEFPDT